MALKHILSSFFNSLPQKLKVQIRFALQTHPQRSLILLIIIVITCCTSAYYKNQLIKLLFNFLKKFKLNKNEESKADIDKSLFRNFPSNKAETALKSNLSELSLLLRENARSMSIDESMFKDTIQENTKLDSLTSKSTSSSPDITPSPHPALALNPFKLKLLKQRSHWRMLLVTTRKLLTADWIVLKKALLLSRIAVPSFFCKESVTILLLLCALVSRTFLSIWIASIHGSVVKTIVDLDLKNFMKCILVLIGYSLPASFVNSSIDYLNKILALLFRRRLTYSFLRRYLHNMVFYHITNIDKRIAHPDQRLTDDITKWSQSLASLFSSITKPILDILFLSNKLSQTVGAQGPLIIITWYSLSAVLTLFIAPAFGKYTAETQSYEGEYRYVHSSIVKHSEEIAFYHGNYFELRRVVTSFEQLWKHSKKVLLKKLFMGCFDNLLVKQGAVIVGYGVVVLPVFGQRKHDYLDQIKYNPSQLTLDYVRNSSLLINLAKAIGRLVVSYKEIQILNGLTGLICEFNDALNDLQNGFYKDNSNSGNHVYSIMSNKGEFIEADYIKFENAPIVTPKGEILVESISFAISQGSNLFILGPNGCGKSTLFRILGELWPLNGGKVYKPSSTQLFYIPQKPYLPNGTLRDQIIYPDTKETFIKKGYQDSYLETLLENVALTYLFTNRAERNFDCYKNWEDQLSGGEKQRLAVARVCYHRPVFAILDEATSAVSVDIEGNLYRYMIDEGITLITISHRLHLLKFHHYILRFNGISNWTFEINDARTVARIQSYSNFMKMIE